MIKNKMNKNELADKKNYACPMHSEVISDKPGRCPKCGMKLEPSPKMVRIKTETFQLPASLRNVDLKLIVQKLKVRRHIVDARINLKDSTAEITFHDGLITREELSEILKSKELLSSEPPLLTGKEAFEIAQHKADIVKTKMEKKL